MISDFVPANEFLDILESSRSIQSSGLEPTIDTMYWTMDLYPFSWNPGVQKVIITMTDEIAQTTVGIHCNEIATMAHDEGRICFICSPQLIPGLCRRGTGQALYSCSKLPDGV
jgi:hypothetical protein